MKATECQETYAVRHTTFLYETTGIQQCWRSILRLLHLLDGLLKFGNFSVLNCLLMCVRFRILWYTIMQQSCLCSHELYCIMLESMFGRLLMPAVAHNKYMCMAPRLLSMSTCACSWKGTTTCPKCICSKYVSSCLIHVNQTLLRKLHAQILTHIMCIRLRKTEALQYVCVPRGDLISELAISATWMT